MRKPSFMLSIFVVFTLGGGRLGLSAPPEAADPLNSGLERTFALAGERSTEPQVFEMESVNIQYAPNGERKNVDVYRLRLKCVPARSEKTADEYVCLGFSLKSGNAPEVAVPALKNWTYAWKGGSGYDDQGQVFGIDHAKFENLTDADGKAILPGNAYCVYNAFIDFHSYNNLFAQRITGGNGLQNLTKIGQKITHAAALSEAPVNLGSSVDPGSSFKNGEITMEFKGLSLVGRSACALLGVDSGESSLKMIQTPAPEMKVTTVGSSHYQGDIYLDLATRWMQKATLDEVCVIETTLPVPPNKVNNVVQRHITIRNVGKE